ncbi:hypothetical protein H6P81_004333 [Aristolochia fimbriata]|uniref:Uncharacterized protein n=1 Tax=Aristolochia fimbriata TaxID=158543 RepID=A0AAV7FF38_ARIFI|nr:hypothetical protein H6P81_004333 [Aristolochia fimbriata]
MEELRKNPKDEKSVRRQAKPKKTVQNNDLFFLCRLTRCGKDRSLRNAEKKTEIGTQRLKNENKFGFRPECGQGRSMKPDKESGVWTIASVRFHSS